MVDLGAAVRLFDARQRRFVSLPPQGESLVVVRFSPRDPAGLHSVDEERGIVLAETLHRFLAWKGFQVRTQDKPRRGGPGNAACPPESRGNSYCVDVLTTGDEPLCHVLVGPAQTGLQCLFAPHSNHGRPTAAVLEQSGLLRDFRFAMLAAGHYRHPRHFGCDGLHYGTSFDDAATTRRRFERLIQRAGPLPAVRSYAEADHALAASPGGHHIDLVDQALSHNLHTPRALHALYAALRRARLSAEERSVLAATADLFAAVYAKTP